MWDICVQRRLRVHVFLRDLCSLYRQDQEICAAVLLGLLPAIRCLGQTQHPASDMRHVQGVLLKVMSGFWLVSRASPSPRLPLYLPRFYIWNPCQTEGFAFERGHSGFMPCCVVVVFQHPGPNREMHSGCAGCFGEVPDRFTGGKSRTGCDILIVILG